MSPSLIAPPLRSSSAKHPGQRCFVLSGPCIRRGNPSGACATTRHSSLQRFLYSLRCVKISWKQNPALVSSVAYVFTQRLSVHRSGSIPLRGLLSTGESPQPAGVTVLCPSSFRSFNTDSSCPMRHKPHALLTHAQKTSAGYDSIHYAWTHARKSGVGSASERVRVLETM